MSQNILNNFKFKENLYSKCRIYEYNGICRIAEIESIYIYTGYVSFLGPLSVPRDISFDLNDYKEISFGFYNHNCGLEKIPSLLGNSYLNLNNIKSSKKVQYRKLRYSYFYELVPIELAKEFFEELIIEENKVHSNKCDFCGDYDKYASFRNNKVRCYRCMYKE